jgi:hypothetical protein
LGWKGVVVKRATPVFQPSLLAGASRVEQFELDGPARLSLHDRRSRPDPAAGDEFTDPNLHDVAVARLAVDGKVEQSPVANTPVPVEPEPYRPNLVRLQRALGPDNASGIPRSPLPGGRVELRMSHFALLLAGLAVGRIRCVGLGRRHPPLKAAAKGETGAKWTGGFGCAMLKGDTDTHRGDPGLDDL